MTTAAGPERHLLIAGTSLPDVDAALALARLILERLPAAPAGLLVETNFAEFVIGTRQRLVAVSGQLQTIPSPADWKRSDGRDAQALRQRIAALAAERAAAWRSEVATGDLVACACGAVAGEDILLLCQRPLLRLRGQVLVLGAAGTPDTEPLRTLAHALAQASGTTVSEIDAGSAAAGLAGALDQVDRSPASAILLDLSRSPGMSEDDLRRLVAAARCPVVVIGASRIRRATPGGA
jgi:hypothetical protein